MSMNYILEKINILEEKLSVTQYGEKRERLLIELNSLLDISIDLALNSKLQEEMKSIK